MRLIDADSLENALMTAICIMKQTMKNLECEDDEGCQMELKAYKDILEGVKEMPAIVATDTNVGRWIPVEKQLPEFPCIVSDINGNPPYIPSSILKIDNIAIDARRLEILGIEPFGCFSQEAFKEIKNIIFCNRITAWMPMPEPYKEEL